MFRREAGYPHCLVLDLGESVKIGGAHYLPRDGESTDPGRFWIARFYVSDQPFGLRPAP